MNALPFRAVLLVLFFASCTATKKTIGTDSRSLDNVKGHIQYLADDKLEGRRTGTPGEKLAMEYISNQFQIIGLIPKGSQGYYQAFSVNDGKQINAGTQFQINGNSLIPGIDFFPFPFSANQAIEALPSIAIQESDMPWFVDLKEILEENKSNPHFDLVDYIRTNSKKAKGKDASAVILYNSSDIADNLEFDAKDRSEQLQIPVVYVSKAVSRKYFSDKSATLNIKLKTDIGDKKRTGTNVVGYIDNGASTTVVLGAHFDHLGYGEDGNSMIRSGAKSIHNGADDNASGTAALIELGRILKTSNAKTNNYLLIAFSGEELGLYGSKYFTENPTIDLRSINYMINMDMVGRLNDSTKVLTVGGYGTSPSWNKIIYSNKTPFTVRIDSSGTGPSDHTSFYRKDIPVLFFFTGLHSDYHKPSDDFEKINYNGTLQIIDYISQVITAADQQPAKLAFTKTREAQTSTSARFSVSLGIMPDYTYAGTGVRADGVSEGKAAQKAGLKTGDVIIQLGEHTISSLENYMQALSKFKKGDRTVVKYKRGNETLEATVEF
jgi:aminopeptidase YwaD